MWLHPHYKIPYIIYKTETRPGLDALYDIRPGNGAGLFLQPRSPHGVGADFGFEVLGQRRNSRPIEEKS